MCFKDCGIKVDLKMYKNPIINVEYTNNKVKHHINDKHARHISDAQRLEYYKIFASGKKP